MKSLNKTLNHFKPSIFSQMSELSRRHNAVNLSQGFPDFSGPHFLLEQLKNEITDTAQDKNQYAPSKGLPILRQVLAERYRTDYDLSFDPESEITITNGATEGIYLTIAALCNPGDEVILFEPFYDSYLAAIQLVGAVPIFARLESPNFSPSLSQWEKRITPRTKLVILNTPHNPSGRVLDDSELSAFSKTVVENDLYVLSDEVYERLIFDQQVHRPIASYPGMRERTVTLSSAGKTFGVTGWKIGWALAAPELSHGIHMAHQFITFSVATPLQWAVAKALMDPQDYFQEFRSHYQNLRDLFIPPLMKFGLNASTPQGSYFCLVDTPKTFENDTEFSNYLVETIGVSAIPCSAFYSQTPPKNSQVRFCFAKKPETLQLALDRLKRIDL